MAVLSFAVQSAGLAALLHVLSDQQNFPEAHSSVVALDAHLHAEPNAVESFVVQAVVVDGASQQSEAAHVDDAHVVLEALA